MLWLLAAGLAPEHWDWVRVEDPDHPMAVASSHTGALLHERPEPGTPWRFASIPEPDQWPATEALEVTHVGPWHASGARGQGVKVAVFDIGWFGGDADPTELGPHSTHDCFVQRSCETPMDPLRPRRASEDGVHGYACAEIVRDIAPEAELFLVRVNGFTMFENAARWAIRNEIDVISMSMSFYNDSFYDGSGPFERVIGELEAHDILLVTSAGNNARQHWTGTYSDADGDGRMDFDGTNGLEISLPPGGASLYVNWNQHYRCGDTDLDAVVYSAEGAIVGSSLDEQVADADQCQPVERLAANSVLGGVHRLEVVHRTGLSSFVEVDILLRGGSVVEAIPDRSVADPAAHRDVFAVGAVRASNYFSGDIEGFSSWGPSNGGVAKPDIAGPDGLSTDVYGPVGFFGTSASTPVVAGLIAVLISDDPSLTPRDASAKLQALALTEGLSVSEPDPRWGAGKARLPLKDPSSLPCGRRPLVMWMLLPPVWWFRKRVRLDEELR